MTKEKTYDLYGTLNNAYIGTIEETSKKKAIKKANSVGFSIKKATLKEEDDSTIKIKQKTVDSYPYKFGQTYLAPRKCSLFGPGLVFYQEPENSRKKAIMLCPSTLEEAEHLFALSRDLVNYHREKVGKKEVK
ncbi:hypothetical protein N9948_01965 [bacterium]|nr:hypothetical protein [bacterium]